MLARLMSLDSCFNLEKKEEKSERERERGRERERERERGRGVVSCLSVIWREGDRK